MAEQQLVAILGADISQFQRAMRNVQGSMNDTANTLNKSMNGAEDQVGKSTNKMGEAFKKVGLIMAGAFAIDKLVDFGKFAITASAEAEAMSAQFEQVFGDMQDSATEMIESMGKDFGMLPNRIKPAMSSMTSMFKGLGMDTETAMATASDAVTIVADSAAFYDKSFEDANASLNSFIKGNYEGGESIGLFANETQLATWASENLGVEWKNLDEAGKQVARLEYAKAMQEASGATGQASRESDGFANVLGNLRQAWTDLSAVLAKPALPIVISAMKGLITVLQGATTWIQNFYDSFGDTSPLEKFSEMFHQIKLDILGGNFSEIAKIIPEMVEGMLGESGGFLGLGATLINNIAEGMGKSVPELMQMLVEIAGAVIEGLVNSLPMILNTGVEMIEGLLKGIISAIPLLTSSASSILTTVVGTIISILPSIIKLGMELLTSLIEGIVQALPLLIEGVTQLITSFVTMLTENLPMIIESGLFLLQALISGIMDNLTLLVESITTVLTTIVQYITENLPMILEMGIELLLTLIEGILDSLPQMVNTILDLVLMITQVILENLPAIIEAGIEILMAVIDGIIDMLPELITCAIELIFAIQQALLDNLPLLLRAGIEIIFALIDGIIEMLPEILGAVDDIVLAIFEGFADVDWLQIGKDILSGIKDGIIANVGTVIGTVQGVANSILKAGKKVLQISSPSKKFEEEVGKAIPEGIAEGVKGESDVALNAVEEMGNMLTVQGLTSRFGQALNNFPAMRGSSARNFENVFNISSLVVREEADLQRLASQLVKEMARQEQVLNRAGGRVQYGY